MLKRKKLFFYSDERVSYVAAKGYRLKMIALVAAATVVGLFVLGFVNNSYGDFLGLGIKTTSELSTENYLLQQHVRELNERMMNYSSSLNSLNWLRIVLFKNLFASMVVYI